MSTYAIISEFNPFHNGHQYIIERARAMGARRIVCIMSGNAVQRGEVSLLSKYARAEMALECGADLVLELPFPFCAAAAEQFAACGVRIADCFADKLIFGSECADVELLRRAAHISASDEFIKKYKDTLKDSSGSAESYFRLLCEALDCHKLHSNDILGIEYIKAINAQGAHLEAVTVKREGAGYLDEDICDGEFQSAGAIRELVRAQRYSELQGYMPQVCLDILLRRAETGEITDASRLDAGMKLFFGMKEACELSGIADVDEGIASRLCNMSRTAGERTLLEAVRTKRYTDSRLRRAMLFSLCSVTASDVRATPAYVNLLAANEEGRGLLSENRKKAGIAVIAKPADIPETTEAKRQFELSEKCDLLFALACATPRSTRDIIARSPIIK